ncbi:MAG: hypothetical protein DHS80DRAFT_21796 [Piptocephalis tieghemiana]|nr:MAG: hypothetical protein DHS80DRAFT_21796 [Piptocephalis tieghemiana]
MNRKTFLLALCLALTVQAKPIDQEQEQEQVPVYYINYQGKNPSVACNYLNYIGHYPENEDMIYHFLDEGIQVDGSNINPELPPTTPKTNRNNAVDARYNGCATGYERDEFPFNALVEGGGWKGKTEPSVRCIPSSENRSDGSIFGKFIAARGIWVQMDIADESDAGKVKRVDKKGKSKGIRPAEVGGFPGDGFKIKVHPNHMPSLAMCLGLKPPSPKSGMKGWKTDVTKEDYLREKLSTLRITKKQKSRPDLRSQRQGITVLRPSKSTIDTKTNRELYMKTDDKRWMRLIDPFLKTTDDRSKVLLERLQEGLSEEVIKSLETIRKFRLRCMEKSAWWKTSHYEKVGVR